MIGWEPPPSNLNIQTYIQEKSHDFLIQVNNILREHFEKCGGDFTYRDADLDIPLVFKAQRENPLYFTIYHCLACGKDILHAGPLHGIYKLEDF